MPCSQWNLGTRWPPPTTKAPRAAPGLAGAGRAHLRPTEDRVSKSESKDCVFARGCRIARLQTSQRTSCFQGQRAFLPSRDGAGEAPGHGSLAFGPSGRAGLGMGRETPSPNQEEPIAGLCYAMTGDLWGQSRGASFSPCSHTFESVTKILGSYYYFMFFPVVFRIIFSVSHTKGRLGYDASFLFQI